MPLGKEVYVPLNCWAFQSPDEDEAGHKANLGALAEALLYYERVWLELSSPEQLAWLISRLAASGSLSDFCSAVSDGEVSFFVRNFFLLPATGRGGTTRLWYVSDPRNDDHYFSRDVLRSEVVREAFPAPRVFREFARAAESSVVLAGSVAFQGAIDAAHLSLQDPRRVQQLGQHLADWHFRRKFGREAPLLKCGLVRTSPAAYNLEWSPSIESLESALGYELTGLRRHLPMSAMGEVHHLARTASILDSDIWGPPVMGGAVNDWLTEVSDPVSGSASTLEVRRVLGLPDIARSVNSGQIPLATVLRWRTRSQKFRTWLQTIDPADVDELAAAIDDGAANLPATKAQRVAVDYALHSAAAAATYGIVETLAPGAGIGAGVLAAVASKSFGDAGVLTGRLVAGWSPTVFSRWLRREHDRARSRIAP